MGLPTCTFKSATFEWLRVMLEGKIPSHIKCFLAVQEPMLDS